MNNLDLRKQIEKAIAQTIKIEKMSDDTVEDQNLFHQIIKTIIDQKYLTVIQISETFSASIPTIQRWADGRNGPHPLLRRSIYETLLEKI